MSSPRPDQEDEVAAVRVAFNDGDRTGALERAKAWLESHPTDGRMWVNVAAMHRVSGDDLASLAAIRRAVTVDADAADAWYIYSSAPAGPDGDLEEQLLAARQMIARFPTISEGYYVASSLLRAHGELNAALDVLEAMRSNVPGPDAPLADLDAQPIPSAYFVGGVRERSVTSLENRDWADVRIAALTWSQLDPGSAQAWFARALAELNEDHHDRALALLHRVTQLDPAHAKGWVLLAFAIRNTGGNLADQQAAARRALELAPDDPQARRALELGPLPTFDPDVRDQWPTFVAAFATLACLLGWFVAHQGGLGTASPPSRPGQPWASIALALPALVLVVTTVLAVQGGGTTLLRTVDRSTRYVYGLSLAVTLLAGWLLVGPRDLAQNGAAITYPVLWVLTAPLALGTLLGWRFLTAGRTSVQ